MSILIEIGENQLQSNQEIFHHFSKLIKATLRNPKFCYLNCIDSGKDIFFSLGGSPQTLYVPSIWKFTIKRQQLNIEIGFIQPDNQMPMQVIAERLKIQCCSIMRTINLQLYPEYKFILNPDTGHILFKFQASLKQLEPITKSKEGLQRLIQNVFLVLRKYFDEVSFFTYTSNNPNQCSQKETESTTVKQAMAAANKYRFLMQSAIKQRRRIQYIVKMKQAGESLKAQAVNLMKIYLNIVDALKMVNFGIQQLQQSSLNYQTLFERQKIEIVKNTHGIANKQKEYKKLVYGITKLDQRGPKELISKQGAHSEIYKQLFQYSTVQTVHFSVNENWRRRPNYREFKCAGYLVIKKCKANLEPSVNSFLNEIKVLQFLKEKRHPFVARYFLLLKSNETRSQKDSIYINAYKQNLHHIIKNHTRMTILQKLTIAYRISKALCFFSINSMIHRDLKPQNIMIDNYYNPKVIDFGSSVAVYDSNCFQVHDRRRKFYINVVLTTPQFHIRFEKLSEKTKRRYHQRQYQQHKLFDIFSFGKILCYIFFNSLSVPTYQQVSNHGQSLLMQHLLWIIRLCLSEDPDDRPGYGQLASFLGCLYKMI